MEQFDLPQEHTESDHRVGRTARLGQQGRALLFLQPTEAPYLELLTRSGAPASLPLPQPPNDPRTLHCP